MNDQTITLLLIEDNPGDARLIQEMLAEGLGGQFDLQRADRLSAGLERLAEADFDLVLLDLSLPDSFGLDTFIKVHEAAPTVPVVLLTGLADETLATTAVQERAQDYLIKGQVDSRLLVRSIRYAIERGRIGVALQESEQKFRGLVENSIDGIVLIDENSKIIEWNSGEERIIGLKRADVIGRLMWDIMYQVLPDNLKTPDLYESLKVGFIHILKSGQSLLPSQVWETDIQQPDGNCRTIEMMFFVYKTNKGFMSGSITRDVTERKSAEIALLQSEARFRSLFEDSPISMWEEDFSGVKQRLNELRQQGVKDFNTYLHDHPEVVAECIGKIKVLDINNATLKLYQAESKADLLGNIDKIINSNSYHSIGDELVAIAEGITAFEKEVVDHTLTGEKIAIKLSWLTAPGHEDNLSKVIVTKIDITEQKLAEASLARHAEELTVLYENTRDLVNLQDLDTLLRLIVERAGSLLHTSSGTIGLFDKARGDIELVTSIGSALAVGSRIARGEGAMGVVVRSLQPLLLDNYEGWEHRLPSMAGIPAKALLAVPMLYSGELVGVLCIFEVGNELRKFNPEDERLLSLFAAQAASAVHNAQLYEERRQNAHQLSLLYDASLALNNVHEPTAQMEYLLKICLELVHSDRAEFYRYDERARSLTFEVGIAGADKSVISKNVTFNLSEEANPVTQAAQYRVPVRINNILEAQEFKVSGSDFVSGLWMPVLHEKQFLGVLSVTCDQLCGFTDQDERMLELFSNQVAVSLETARLFQETNLHMQRIQALRAIDIAISGSFDVRIVLDLILEQLTHQLKVDAADVLLYNIGLNQLEFAAGRGFRTSFLKYTYLKPGEGYAGKAIEDLRTIYVENLRAGSDGLKHSPNFDDEAFVSYFCVPLVSKGQVKGVLEIFHRSTLQPEEEWLNFLETLAGQVAIALDNSLMFTEQQRSAMRISMAYDATIEGWSRALDSRDQDTEGHTLRVTQLTLRLAREIGTSESDLVHIRRGALLHDIGKMGVPDRILLKPGPLDADEWEIMRKHPESAYQLLLPIEFLRPALDIPYSHHEKWDGSGYPRSLKGDAIPLAARIFAVVDVWDALNSDRPYRKALSREECIHYIEEQRGKHFDPRVVDIFLRFIGK